MADTIDAGDSTPRQITSRDGSLETIRPASRLAHGHLCVVSSSQAMESCSAGAVGALSNADATGLLNAHVYESDLSRAEPQNRKADALVAWLASTHSEPHVVDGGFVVEDVVHTPENGVEVQEHYTHLGISHDDDSPPALSEAQSPPTPLVEGPATPQSNEHHHPALHQGLDAGVASFPHSDEESGEDDSVPPYVGSASGH